MFWIKLALLFQFFVWIQIKVPVDLFFIPLSFDLILLSVVAVGLCFGVKRGILAGMIGGLILDSLSVAPLGFHVSGYALIGYLSGRWQRFYYLPSLKTHLFVVAVMGSLLFLEQLALQLFFFSTSLWNALYEKLFFSILLNLLLTPLILFVMRIFRLIVKRDQPIRTPYEEFVVHS